MPWDPMLNVINDGIMKGIAVAIDNNCYGSAVILIYAGIDAMAFLTLPEAQEDVTRKEFIEWVDKYIHFNGEEQLSGIELYAARCGMLHNYSAFSRLTRKGNLRIIGYVDEAGIEVMTDKDVPNLAIVSIKALARAFSRGVQRYVNDLHGNPQAINLVRQRVSSLVQVTDLPSELRSL